MKGVLCPVCKAAKHRVVDVRPTARGLHRRRECLNCGYRFQTKERIEDDQNRAREDLLLTMFQRMDGNDQTVLMRIAIAMRAAPLDAIAGEPASPSPTKSESAEP